MCTTLSQLTTVDELDTDDEDMETYGLMVHTQLNVYANFGKASSFTKAGLAYFDSGADSCILGKDAFMTSYAGRHANLVGYNPSSTKTKSVPICSGYIKVKSQVGIPVVLHIHEASFLETMPFCLLSEYQIRDYGLIIDSTAPQHKGINND